MLITVTFFRRSVQLSSFSGRPSTSTPDCSASSPPIHRTQSFTIRTTNCPPRAALDIKLSQSDYRSQCKEAHTKEHESDFDGATLWHKMSSTFRAAFIVSDNGIHKKSSLRLVQCDLRTLRPRGATANGQGCFPRTSAVFVGP